MRALGRTWLVLAGFCSLVLASCDAFFGETWEWRQKLTVEVETPDGVKTGASVVGVSRERAPEWFGALGGMGYEVTGEATVLEVAPGRYLFALLVGAGGNHAYHAELPIRLFFEKMEYQAGQPPVKERVKAQMDAVVALREARTLPREHYPLLVTFGDIADPTSVRKVDPDDLAASFGPGVGLTRITLEMTDGPVTEGRVEQVLGWLETIGGKTLDGESTSFLGAANRLANDLSRLDFRRR